MATQVIAGPLPVERDSEQARKRRRAWIAWLAVILAIFLCLFTCGQLSLLGAAPDTSGMASGSAMNADYAAWQGWSFGPLLPQIALEAIRDLGMGDPFAVATSTTCLLGNTCPTATAVSPSSTPHGGPSATPTGGASPTPAAPTSTQAAPTNTGQPPDTPTHTSTPTQTPTPTPLVYPIKLANPSSIPPGPAPVPVQFTIMVINYGNPTGAELTAVIDRLPPEMSFAGGCNPAGCVAVGNEVRWSGSWMIAQGSFRTFNFTANAAGTLAGQVLTNEVETQGGNFQTAVNVRRVYVYTPTPTATPIAIPTAVDDVARTDEDVPAVVNVLANDTNLRDLPMTVSIAVAPGFGSAVVLGGNTIRYTPNPDWFGTDTFQYRVTDASVPVGDWDIGLVTVIVDPVNDTPVAIDDNPLGVPLPVSEDTPAALNVLANDTGIGDTPLLVTILSGPSQGSAIVLVSNQIRYQGSLNYNGLDSLVYRVTDVDGEFDDATLSINVLPVNDAPVAAADAGYVVIEDRVLDTGGSGYSPPPPASVLANDTDVDCTPPATDCNPSLAGNNPLTAWPAVIQPLNGTVQQMRADGTFVYIPRANFFGSDAFTYWASDGSLFSAQTVQVTVLSDPADIPDANPDSFPINEDTPTQLDVLANDTSWFDIPLTLELGDLPDHGVALVQYLDNSVIPPVIRILYSPVANWYGNDSFTYCVRDVGGEPHNPCDPADFATVDVHVLSVPDPPTTVDDIGSMSEDQILPPTLIIDVLFNDSWVDALIAPSTVCIVGRPCPILGFPIGVAGGRITDIDPATGAIEFLPNDDFNGTVTFQYTVADTSGLRAAPALVTITVSPTNDTPFAVPDEAATVVGRDININVLANDIGIGDIPLVVTVVPPLPNPADGTCAPNGTQVRFTPGASFAAPVVCRYRVTDGDLPVGQWSEADITIYVNMPPTAVDDPTPLIGVPIVTLQNVDVVINVLANDSDPDDGLNPATVTIVNSPGNGSIFAINLVTGAITYRPNPGYRGADTFTYRVRDNHVPAAPSNIARVDITISGNGQPTAMDDTDTAQQGAFKDINVLANDTDPDLPPDPLTIIDIPTPPGDGTATIDDNGTPGIPADDFIHYIPDSGFFGTDTLEYTIDDGSGAPNSTDSAIVTVRVNGRPTAWNDTATTPQDVSADIDVLDNDTDPDVPPDPLTITGVTDPPHGLAVINNNLTPGNPADDFIRYTPDTFYLGADSFNYTIADGVGGITTATVSVMVLDADSAPQARDDPGLGFPALLVGEGQTISIAVLANDLGLGDAPFTVVAGPPFLPPPSFPGCPAAGAVSVIGSPGPSAGIRVEYSAPSLECAGTVTFSYTVTDGDVSPYLPAESSTATVTLTVFPVNDPPVAGDDGPYFTDEDTPLSIAAPGLLTNDSDPAEGSPVTAQPASGTSAMGGSYSVAADGSFSYAPGANDFGTDTLTYRAFDGTGLSLPATVTIQIAPVNDPPIAANRSASTNQGVPVTITVAATDIDGSVNLSTAAVVGGPANGTVFNNGDGTFTYTPTVAPFLSDSFTYQVWDNDGAPSNVATVTIGIVKPDLALAKDGPASAAPGEEIWFFITVANNGPGIAFSVSLSDTLGNCFTWLDPPLTGSLGNLAEGAGTVLSGRARVRDPLPGGCDNTNRAEATAANADPSDETVTVDLGVPITGLPMMLMALFVDTPTPTATAIDTATPTATEVTPTDTPASIETATPAATEGTPTSEPTPTLVPEVSETSLAETPSATPLASDPPPTLEGTATAEETPVETSAPTDPPTEAPPTPEPVVVPTEEATAPPEPSEPPAPAPEPPGPVPEPPLPEPPTEPLVGEEAPAMPPGGGEEPPSESMAAVLTNVRWDRLSRRPLWGRADGVYAASDSGWLIRYLFGLFAPPGAPTVSPTPMPGP